MKNKMNKMLKTVSVALVSILMFNISSYAFANTKSETNDLSSDVNPFSMYDVSGNIKNTPLENLEVEEADLIKLQNEVHKNYPFVDIDESTISKKIISAKNTNDVNYSISYSLTGENVEGNSNVDFLYDEDSKLLSTQYSVAIENANGDIQANIYTDNLKTFEINTEKDQKTNQDNVTSVIKFSENGEKEDITLSVIGAKSFWSCFNSCLSSQGIASWAVAAIGIACAAICAGTAGVGCIPCIHAAGILADATIAYCVGKCL